MEQPGKKLGEVSKGCGRLSKVEVFPRPARSNQERPAMSEAITERIGEIHVTLCR